MKSIYLVAVCFSGLIFGCTFNSTYLNENSEKIKAEKVATGGVIDESIKVITHSMGGAYGKGYIQAILDYAKKHEIAGVNVAFEADFAAFQTDQQSSERC